MEYTIPAKPAIYQNIQFRSHLEARWAAFFDLIGWEWEYEPFTMPGWIPDFKVFGLDDRFILFEIKPYLNESILKEYAAKISSAARITDGLNTQDYFLPHCIILSNSFFYKDSFKNILAGYQITHQGDYFPVHWKEYQHNKNQFDIGSEEMWFNGLLYNDERHRKNFLELETEEYATLLGYWLDAGKTIFPHSSTF